MSLVAKEAIEALIPGIDFTIENEFSTGSTDMGDLSCIMPVVHPYAGGAAGKSHGNDYQIVDPETACVMCAKWQVLMLSILLSDNAKRAKEVLKGFKPMFASKEEFLAYQDSINTSGDRIDYSQSGKAIITNDVPKNADSEEKV
jgi:hypothetical protein